MATWKPNYLETLSHISKIANKPWLNKYRHFRHSVRFTMLAVLSEPWLSGQESWFSVFGLSDSYEEAKGVYGCLFQFCFFVLQSATPATTSFSRAVWNNVHQASQWAPSPSTTQWETSYHQLPSQPACPARCPAWPAVASALWPACPAPLTAPWTPSLAPACTSTSTCASPLAASWWARGTRDRSSSWAPGCPSLSQCSAAWPSSPPSLASSCCCSCAQARSSSCPLWRAAAAASGEASALGEIGWCRIAASRQCGGMMR